MPLCGTCGRDNAADSRFCSACGAPIASAPTGTEQRKTVSVVFCDLAGSTALGERLDPESLRRLMASYYGAMRAAVERHGGRVERYIGDAVMAVFGVPVVHEDDAVRAVRAAVDMRVALEELNAELRERWGIGLTTRTGVNTGEVVTGDQAAAESFLVGDPVNLSARLEQAAGEGEILIGKETHRLVRDCVDVERVPPLELKGKTDPVAAFRLLGVKPGAPGVARRLDLQLIGRKGEGRRLEEAFDRVFAVGGIERLTVLGPAGVGKSRLARELTERLSDRARVVTGRCLPYGEGITFWPLAELVHRSAGIDESESRDAARAKLERLLGSGAEDRAVAARIAAALGLSPVPAPPEEIFRAARGLLERLGGGGPLVVIFDDVQWAEPTFLDLLEYLPHPGPGPPVLLLLLARPELREVRHALTDPSATEVLEPLPADESARLVSALLGEGEVAPEVLRRLLATAGGNPLFLEELVRMLADEGRLERRGDRWEAAGDPEAAWMPPTLQALLDARLARLSPEERGVIEPASIVGQEFWGGAVAELAPERIRADLDLYLGTLVEKELVSPSAATFLDEEAFRFAHILIRDAAYAGLLREARAEGHERFAGWLEAKLGERVAEHEEVLGYHLEQAFRHREQLGRPAESDRALAGRGAQRLGAAGRRAAGRGDMPAAANLLERAAALLGPGPARRELELRLGVVLAELGEVDRADAALRDAAVAAGAAGDRRIEVRAELERAYWRFATGATTTSDELSRAAADALPVLEEAGDDAGLARAWGNRALIQSIACRWAACGDALRHGLEHARRGEDRQQEMELLWHLTGALQYGPTPVEEGIRLLAEALDEASTSSGAPSWSTRALVEATGLAGLEAMGGDLDAARRHVAQTKERLLELGQTLRAAALEQMAGWIELFAGDPALAEARLRDSYASLEAMGETAYFATTAAFLAEAVYLQDRFEEAERLTVDAERSAARDDAVSQILWRGTRAKVLARRDELDAAEALADEAVALAGATDDLNLLADRLVDQAEVRRRRGRDDAADEAVRRAIGLYEAKGNVASAARVRR